MSDAAHPTSNDPAVLRGIIGELLGQLADAQQEREAQQRELATQTAALQEREQRIEQLLEYIELLRRKRFGPSSDRVAEGQLALFDEAELEALIEALEGDLAAAAKESLPKDTATQEPKRKPVRRPLPAHLPRVEHVLDLSEEEKAAMGGDWVAIGYDVSEQLAVIPRQYYVVAYKRTKYAPCNDEVPGAEAGVKIAPRPAQILPKSIAHSSLAAAIVTAKFVDAIPLYRQEKGFARDGIELSRQTMAGLLIQLGQRLTPVAEAMQRLLRQGRVVHIDETRLQVLREPGREAEQHSYMWVFCGGPPGQPVIWFHYAPSRAGAVPRQVLLSQTDPPGADPPDRPPGFYLQSDGYAAYNALAAQPVVLGHAGCWAQVRRKFADAAAARKKPGAAHEMLAHIARLYAVERAIRGHDPATRAMVRTERSRPILDTVKAWLDAKVRKTLPKGLLGKAIEYALGQWPLLTTYLADGHLEIDNNRAENAIRPFVVGRKNWLFSGSPRGAQTSALLYSLIETAKANGLEPWAYLNHLFEHLPTARTPAAVAALLPHYFKPDDLKQ
jgi:transposase